MTGIRFGRVVLLVGLALFGSAGAARAEEREFTVHVSYDEFQEEARPKPGRRVVKQNVAFTPLGGDALRVVVVRVSSLGVMSETAEVTLGKAGEGPLRNVRWSRPDAATYVRVQTTPTYVIRLTATITGQSCEAAVAYELKPGHTEYQMVRTRDPNEKTYMRTLRADQVTCWIGDYLVS